MICFLLMAVVAISKSHRIFGISTESGDKTEMVEPMVQKDDGAIMVNTTSLTKNVIGYVGPTPVEITVRDGRISRIKALENHETPEVIGAVLNSDLLESWDGKTLQEAADFHPDAVSGATISSNAVIKNVQAGIAYAQGHSIPKKEAYEMPLDVKFFCVCFIILAAAILPLFIKNPRYRLVQLLLNVLVLGFWGGTFISYTVMTSLMTNGIHSWMQIPVMIMVVTAFFYPFFGKLNHYCNWICPYGSIQELAGKCVPFKIKLSPGGAKALTYFREVLWVGLMIVMMAGLWFDWMDWEPFVAFFFHDVSPIALGIAGGFLLLSFFIQRPYCRFVCPTGTLFKISEATK